MDRILTVDQVSRIEKSHIATALDAKTRYDVEPAKYAQIIAAIGTPYVWAGGSSNGYDCSGLTKMAWAAAGVSLPHNAASQWNSMAHIGRDALSPGDLVFYSAWATSASMSATARSSMPHRPATTSGWPAWT